MNKKTRLDIGVGAGLVVALGAVIALEPAAPRPASEDASPARVVPAEAPEAATASLRLAVTPPRYDDMGRLLEQLGSGYKYDRISDEDLEHFDRIQDYDVIFWTCDGVPRTWVTNTSETSGGRPGTVQVEVGPEVIEHLRSSLGAFLGRGRTLYASDWWYGILARVFPDLRDERNAGEGKAQTVTASVVDPGLREIIGPRITLNFDADAWRTAALTGPGTTVYLRGRYQDMDDETHEAPFLVKVPYRDGTIIFTSFHNEKNNSDEERKILEHLVFSAVTARQTQKVSESLVKDGFSPARTTMLGASAPNVTKKTTYHHARSGPLRFVLGFANAGARLKLDIAGPDGTHLEQEGASTISLEVPQAAAGDWTVTITALKVPYENFAFTLTIGER